MQGEIDILRIDQIETAVKPAWIWHKVRVDEEETALRHEASWFYGSFFVSRQRVFLINTKVSVEIFIDNMYNKIRDMPWISYISVKKSAAKGKRRRSLYERHYDGTGGEDPPEYL